MRGEISSGKHAKRHPLDWYVEEPWVVRQLIEAMGDFRREFAAGETIWDPACGRGTIPGEFIDMAAVCRPEFSQRLLLSDVVRNVAADRLEGARWEFIPADFLELTEAPAPCSIVCNPPYSYLRVGGLLISELFARHALKLTSRRVCLLLPSKWLASQSRYFLFSEFPPAAVLHLCQRPSMPPGDRIAAMGNRAFRGGMVDYCWVVWDVTLDVRIGQTRTVWLPPLGRPINPIEGLA